MNVSALDLRICEDLAARAAKGDADARRSLSELLWPVWPDAVRSNHSMGPLAASADHVENVVGQLVEKIARPDGHNLRLYLAWHEEDAHREQTFADWIQIVIKNVIRSYVRHHLGSGEAAASHQPSPKRLLNEFAMSGGVEELGVRPPMTAAQTAREMLEFAAAHLPSDQVRALRLWLQGESADEIGRALGLSAASAQKSVHAGVAALRRHFRPVEPTFNAREEEE